VAVSAHRKAQQYFCKIDNLLDAFSRVCVRTIAMKKSIKVAKLAVKRETLKTLKQDSLGLVAGAAPVRTRDLPCIELTARDCD
jgi:hypothetical protein